MIHHLSIPARHTRHVADVLAELFGGVVTGFGPYPNSILAVAEREDWRALRLPRGPFDVIEFWMSANPMQRFGEPHEVAALVAFLLSGKAPFINGAVITIDGGQSYKY